MDCLTVIEGILVEYEGMDWSPILSPSTVLLMSVALLNPECPVFPASP